jgi:polysaccharide deacetylase 2 family uncharacterized protein YibQ
VTHFHRKNIAKKKNNTPKRSRAARNEVRRRIFLVFIGIILTAVMLALAGSILQRRPAKNVSSNKPVAPPRPHPPPIVRLPENNLPKLAVIIDDIGYDIKAVDRLLLIDAPITFSILPGAPHSLEAARRIHDAGHEVMLHLPMEPLDTEYADPGPDALLTSMSDDKIHEKLLLNLRAVPGVTGVNNHMGSRFTRDEKGMRIVLEELRSRGLFFVDSRTTPDSVGYRLAGQMGLRRGERDLFLDRSGSWRDSEEYVRKQWDELVHVALTKGHAIGIGHPKDGTINVLTELIPRLKQEGVALAPVSMVLDSEPR